jgi:SPP1 gp7 family putative phage head morphogenesis protein
LVGSEYLGETARYLSSPKKYLTEISVLKILPRGKKTTPLKGVPPDVTEAELAFFFRNRKGKLIFQPVYDIYKENFINALLEQTKLITTFDYFRNTGIYERYMLNAVQFAAAKSVSEGKAIQAQVFDDKGVVRSYPAFKKQAEQITTIQNKVWLRVERDAAVKGAVSLDQFSDMIENADLYPYWQYTGVMDDREREEHVELEGKIFMIGDSEGDACFPPNGFNCRCTGDPLDETDVKGKQIDKGKDALEHVDKRFQYNPAEQGILPRGHSYFDVLPSANSASWKTYFANEETEQAGGNTRLKAPGLHYLVTIVAEWRQAYHVNKDDNIVFQNKRLHTNVVFSNNSLHAVQHHPEGFENLPGTIQAPDEVWSLWADPAEQKQTLRAYIKGGYVVMTSDGVVIDARQVTGSINKYRKGCLL